MNLISSFVLVSGIFGFSSFSSAAARAGEVPTVARVDLNSYVGLWHEIARIENQFQDGASNKGRGPCRNTTAEYGVLPKGKLSVKNSCVRDANVTDVAIARARVVKGSNNAKLKVNFTGHRVLEFLGIGDGDYWVLALGPLNESQQYSWVLVGSSKLSYGWVLSRTSEMPETDLNHILDIASSIGYDRTQFKSF